MRLNVKATINDYNGDPMPIDEKKPDGEMMTLGKMMFTVLNAQLQDEAKLEAEKKFHRGMLAQDIHNAGKDDSDGYVDLPVEDVTMIKELIGKLYPPLSLMRAYEIIDPKPSKAEDKKSAT